MGSPLSRLSPKPRQGIRGVLVFGGAEPPVLGVEGAGRQHSRLGRRDLGFWAWFEGWECPCRGMLVCGWGTRGSEKHPESWGSNKETKPARGEGHRGPAGCEMGSPASASAGPTPAAPSQGPDPARRPGPSANYRLGWKRRRFNLICACGGSGPAVPRRPRGTPRAAIPLGRAGRTGPALRPLPTAPPARRGC